MALHACVPKLTMKIQYFPSQIFDNFFKIKIKISISENNIINVEAAKMLKVVQIGQP